MQTNLNEYQQIWAHRSIPRYLDFWPYKLYIMIGGTQLVWYGSLSGDFISILCHMGYQL